MAKRKRSTKVKNSEKAEAYSLPKELELYSLVCTSMLDNQFYRTQKDTMTQLRKLVKAVDPVFVAKLAVYAREKMYLRTMPVVLAVELAKVHSGDSLVSQMTERVIQRADEIPEILACYAELNGQGRINKLSKQIQKGVANAFNKFEEYHFAKYNRDGIVKMKDALFVTHPVPKDKNQEELFAKIANDNLEVPYTWEVELSKKDGRSKKEKWEDLIASKKVGYMALMRNLRNMLDAEVSKEHVEQVCGYLSSPEAVQKARQLPFRFFSAYQMLYNHGNPLSKDVLVALNEAVRVSIDNVPFLIEGENVIACDVSGSMQTNMSERSQMQMYDVGLLLGQLLKLRAKDTVVGIFGDIWKVKNFRSEKVLDNTMALHSIEGEVGYSTNGYLVIEDLIAKGKKKDKVFIFTDCQMWDSYGVGNSFRESWKTYKKIAPEAKLYLFDLQGYGNTPVSVLDKDVTFVSGWSDKIFEMLEALESGSDAVAEIEKIVL